MTEGWVEITADWKGDISFIGNNQDGGSVQMGTLDGRPGIGPMQLLLAAMAGCTGMDIVSILKKKKIDIQDFKIKIRGQQSDDYPKIWKAIEVQYLIWASNLTEKDMVQAIRLSEDKYCSVGITLSQLAEIKSSYVINK